MSESYIVNCRSCGKELANQGIQYRQFYRIRKKFFKIIYDYINDYINAI